MKANLNRSKSKLKKSCTAVLSAILAVQLSVPAVYAQSNSTGEPAQAPLIATNTMAAPNIMLIYDNSGSMASLSVPDELESIYGGMYVGSLHPDDRSGTGGEPSIPRVVAADPADVFSAMMRSHQVNKIYYNPASTYTPWLKADGQPMPWYEADSVPVYAATGGAAGTARVNLRGGRNTTFTFPSSGTSRRYLCEWSGSSSYNSARCSNYSTNKTFIPAIYFNYRGPGATDPDFGWTSGDANIRNIRNYEPVIIDEIGPGGIKQAATRTDCKTLASTEAGTVQCTKEEEYKNFATWYAYYRDRARAAIGALTLVFGKDYDMQYRLGWSNLASSYSSIDGVGYYYMKQGVRLYDDANRTRLYNWLYALERNHQYGTPTRSALNEVGNYYMRTDNAGPWGADPGNKSNIMPQLGCRKSYSIVMTDGGWNDSFGSVGNADGSDNLTAITGPNGKSFRYIAQPPFRDAVSNTMADIAMYYWKTDLRGDLPNIVPTANDSDAFWQHMITHTVGFGVKGTLSEANWADIVAGRVSWPTNFSSLAQKTDDLWHTAVNGRGTYSSASDVNTLVKSLGSIMQELAETNLTSPYSVTVTEFFNSDPSVNSNNRQYVPNYMTGRWTGDLVSYKLNSKGGLGAVEWRASERLLAPANRNIWINTPEGIKAFQYALLPEDVQRQFGSATSTPVERQAMVNFLRGDNTEAGVGKMFRERSSNYLGDIVNSKPVYVKDAASLGYNRLPDGAAGKTAYMAYYNQKSNRNGVVFVGGNDGMLHAFATDVNSDFDLGEAGKEVFAFIPNSLIHKLRSLGSAVYDKNHQYYVDGPLTLTDAYWGTCVGDNISCWRNVLLGSTGAGAKSVFALDVTDPRTYAKMGTNNITAAKVSSTVLWELSPSSTNMEDLGFVMQPLQAGYIGTVTGGSGPGSTLHNNWVGVFGNGAYSASGKAVLYVVNLKDGTLLHSITLPGGNNNGLMGVTLIRDKHQVITGAYAGDLRGNLWKFNFSSANKANWSATKLFSTHDNRPITQAPAYTAHPLQADTNMVLFGTGKFYDISDTSDISLNGKEYIYGIWDQGSNIGLGQLLERKTKPVQDGKYFDLVDPTLQLNTKKGWFIKLDMKVGQRSLYTPRITGTDVSFNTTLTEMGADKSESCSVEALKGLTVMVNLFTGGYPSVKWDTNADGVVDGGDAFYIGATTESGGEGTVLADNDMGQGPRNENGKPYCEPGMAYIVVNGLPGCKKAVDNTTGMQLF